MTRTKESDSRPAGNGPASKSLGNDSDSTAWTDSSDRARSVVSEVKDAYAVLVVGKAKRRHVFFGLPAAQKAVERAHARGDFADLVLVKLTPVGEI